ncbi:DUF6635 family protein [Paracoccus spongiarum]|uniref:ABC transporter ATP-binding protein n=1 Tax=Paracoccus spongiarum TaxID=3064387 RepID=A0ABT9JCI8_9RHOB|nr:DUF6635 family protein [Paracoccus sp. 2205BS29-5]MDP5307525.1 hypothetical protein [Paracoccus sp. 2205BS29-5]
MTVDQDVEAARRRAVEGFVRARYGPRGTLRLHRAALGLDLLRAPVNVMLSPVFLLSRLIAWGLGRLGLAGPARWLAARQIFLQSDLARTLNQDLTAFLDAMQAQRLIPQLPSGIRRPIVDAYTETRNAVAEITTSLIVLGTGLFMFGAATPGVISLAGPLAEQRARNRAIEEFVLGNGLGRLWTGLFPAEPTTTQVVLTGLVLAALASLVTTFAGLLADPAQVWTGIHRRRLMRLIARIDRGAETQGLAGEHLLARSGDLADAVLTLWRSLRG